MRWQSGTCALTWTACPALTGTPVAAEAHRGGLLWGGSGVHGVFLGTTLAQVIRFETRLCVSRALPPPWMPPQFPGPLALLGLDPQAERRLRWRLVLRLLVRQLAMSRQLALRELAPRRLAPSETKAAT